MIPTRKNYAGNPGLRCRKCEDWLDTPTQIQIDHVKHGIQPNRHGVVIRQCLGCKQRWLGYVQELPNCKMKIILKKVDKIE
jgi:hypothetical protein